MNLGDWGADVIKVEHPKRGDDTRHWGPPFRDGESSYFLSVNRNKRSIGLDLKNPADLETVYDLVEDVDVVVEAFKPGKADELGIGYGKLSSINPGLVYASISGFGADGPRASHAGYDVAVAALSGFMSITGPEDGAPVKAGVAVTDLQTGLHLQAGVCAALFARERNGGQGQHVRTSLLQAQIAGLANIGANVLMGAGTRRWGTAHESIVPYQVFPSKDGDLLVAAMNDAQFVRLSKVCGQTWHDDDRFKTNSGRVEHRKELLGLLSDVLLHKTRSEWAAVFSPEGVPCVPVNSVREALDDPQVRHLELVQTIQHDKLGDLEVIGPAVEFSDTPCSIRRPPPLLGQHTDEVLAELKTKKKGQK